jgi:hypothetical protein
LPEETVHHNAKDMLFASKRRDYESLDTIEEAAEEEEEEENRRQAIARHAAYIATSVIFAILLLRVLPYCCR